MASDKEISLTYASDDDRACALAGMAVSLASLDALDYVISFSLDAPDTMVAFSPEFYYFTSPALSPKAVWDHLVRKFYITASMAIANVMARAALRHKSDIPRPLLDELKTAIAAEGRDTCALDDDEIEELYLQVLSRSRRIFLNPRLHPAIGQLAELISARRALTSHEIAEELHLLQLI